MTPEEKALTLLRRLAARNKIGSYDEVLCGYINEAREIVAEADRSKALVKAREIYARHFYEGTVGVLNDEYDGEPEMAAILEALETTI